MNEKILRALKELVEWAKQAEVALDCEFGSGRTRADFDADNEWSNEIIDAVQAIKEAEKRENR